MSDRCPVCYGTERTLDYDYTGDGELAVERCDVCGWPPNGPHTVAEYREKWLRAGETGWSHPSPAKLRHIGVLLELLEASREARDE